METETENAGASAGASQTASAGVHVFNQYYFDLLKKLKDIAKNNRKQDFSPIIRKAIKESYTSYDKLSNVYSKFFFDYLNHYMIHYIIVEDYLCSYLLTN